MRPVKTEAFTAGIDTVLTMVALLTLAAGFFIIIAGAVVYGASTAVGAAGAPELLTNTFMVGVGVTTVGFGFNLLLLFLKFALTGRRESIFPHWYDFFAPVQPQGYGLAGLLINGLNACIFPPLLTFLFVWIPSHVEQWPNFTFPIGAFVPPNVPPGHATTLATLAAAYICLFSGMVASLSATQAFHMWHRGTGRLAIQPPNEVASSYLV